MIKPGDVFVEVIGIRTKSTKKLKTAWTLELGDDFRAFFNFTGPVIPILFLHPGGYENNKVVFLGFSKTRPKTTGVFINSVGSIEEIDLEFFMEEILNKFVTKLEIEDAK